MSVKYSTFVRDFFKYYNLKTLTLLVGIIHVRNALKHFACIAISVNFKSVTGKVRVK